MIERGTSKSFVARIYSIAIVMIKMLVQSLVINRLFFFVLVLLKSKVSHVGKENRVVAFVSEPRSRKGFSVS